MFSHLGTNANKSLEPPLSYPGATPDAERAHKPPLPEPPYKPYDKQPAPPEPPYEPYKRHVAAGQRSIYGCCSIPRALLAPSPVVPCQAHDHGLCRADRRVL